MKIFHTADWHIGHIFYGNDRTHEHGHFLNWLLQQTRKQRPDVFLISGDIFDSYNVNVKSVCLFETFLEQLTRENPEMRTIITTGNHDYLRQQESSLAIYNRLGVQLRTIVPKDNKGKIDYEELCIPVSAVNNPEETAVILAVPYLEQQEVLSSSKAENVIKFFDELIKTAKKRFPNVPVILMAHVFASGTKITIPESYKTIPVEAYNTVDVASFSTEVSYMALGHVHEAQAVGEKNNIWYAGSPLALDFHERDFQHGINMLNIQADGSGLLERLTYQPLCQIISAPSEGGMSIHDAMKFVSSFEKTNKKGQDTACPYVELKINEDALTEQKLEMLEEEISQRQIRVCKLKNISQKQEKEKYSDFTYEELQQIIPGKIARDLYSQTYKEEMPDDMTQLLAEIKRTCETL